MTTLEIDDAETAHTERYTIPQVMAFVVRSAMDQAAAHFTQSLFVGAGVLP